MPGRQYSSNSYRYGYNGKENDNEVVGTGEGTQDYGMRIYNPALGRFLSVDPLYASYPSWSPYPFAMNRPIDGIDIDGLEWIHYVWKQVKEVKLKNGDSKFIFTKMTTGNGKILEDWVYDKSISGTKDVQWYIFENKLYDFPYKIPGYTESINKERERQIRAFKNVLTITGGGITIVATGGVAAVAVEGMSLLTSATYATGIISAQIAIAGGSTKLILDLAGKDKALVDKIPTSAGGVLGVTVDYAIGEKKGKFQAVGDIVDGVLTFNIPKTLTESTSAALSITNIVITALDLKESLKEEKKEKKKETNSKVEKKATN